MRPAGRPGLFGREVRHLHCVGVGGMGMAPLAIYLVQAGFTVTGEDDALTEDMRALLSRERVTVGSLPADCELVVYSSAIAKTHPAYAAALARKLPLVRRGELLAEALRGKKLVAVCGSHGKTTTTAMLISALRTAGFPAGWVLGGLFADDTPPARTGSSDWVVAEIDESDGTIDAFSPEVTVAVNLDWDHPDFYRREADLEATFAALFERTRGPVLVSDACALSARIAPMAKTFGRSGKFSATISSESAGRMILRLGGEFTIAEAAVKAQGDFNAANATAALAAAQLVGATLSPTLLAEYPGVRRRQSTLHAADGLTVIEDYAHHPAEIRALLASLRRRVADSGRLIVVFQPHRFSRTAQFKAEFAAALAVADSVHLLDVYAAGEAPIAGGTTADIYAELKRIAGALPLSYLPGGGTGFFRALSQGARAGDLVAFVGAGDIDRLARGWIEVLKEDAMKAQRWDDLFAAVKPLLAKETKFKREEPLAAKTTMRVGGAARLYAEPASVADLQTLLRETAARGIEVFMLGRGSNLIVPDEGVDGLVLSLAHETWAKFESRGDGRVWVGAGVRLKNLCGLAAKAGLTGFEFLEGIPGNLGGALRMNAGAMGGWMFDVVQEVQLMTMAGEVQTLAKAAMHVDYRHCAELHHAIALGALLRPASQADAEAVARQIDVYKRKRQESQPREPSAGCIFKNPPGNSAGRLIDESGLKGERVGDAEVSTVHANFIVNRGAATAAEILELVRRVRARVRQVKGVDLEPEVLLYGEKLEGRAVKQPIIAVFAGGTSAEREVSLGSGLACAIALSRSFPTRLFDVTANALPAALDASRHVVFSTLHGTFGEDGGMQRLLEAAHVEYAGCGIEASALTMDKARTKQVAAASGVVGTKGILFNAQSKPAIAAVVGQLGEQLVVKPNSEGSSIGLNIVASRQELIAAFDKITSGNWLVEQRVIGREFAVGVLGSKAMGIVEIRPKSGIYDYTSKYTVGASEYFAPAPLDAGMTATMCRDAETAYAACGCRDYARVDFLLSDKNELYLLEINTLPGMKETSSLPMSARCVGLDFTALVREMVTPALRRFHAANASSEP